MSGLLALTWYFVALIILLVLSGFFSGSETALFSLSRAQVKRMSKGSKSEQAATELLHQPQRLLSTLLVGNLLVNVTIASLIGILVRRFFGNSGVGIAILLSTFLLLIFGEVTPKTIAVQHALAVAHLVSRPLRAFSTIIRPLQYLLRKVTNLMLLAIKQRHIAGWGLLTQEEISGMLAAGEAAGVAHQRECELVEHILNLGTIDAHDIMVPRTEVIGINDSVTVAEAYEIACTCQHSRLPVYHEDLDDIWGLIFVADLPKWRNSEMMTRTLADLRNEHEPQLSTIPEPLSSPVYPVYVVPETVKVEKLLTTMKNLHAQLVVLVDEYGGTAGILTLEDILEEVVGQLSPAEEDTGQDFRVAEDHILVDGQMHIRDLNRKLALHIPSNGADTIGGHVMDLLGRLPRAGDSAEDEGYVFHVVKMTGRCVGVLRLETKEEQQK